MDGVHERFEGVPTSPVSPLRSAGGLRSCTAKASLITSSSAYSNGAWTLEVSFFLKSEFFLWAYC